MRCDHKTLIQDQFTFAGRGRKMPKACQILLLFLFLVSRNTAIAHLPGVEELLKKADQAAEKTSNLRYDWAYWDTMATTGRIDGSLKLSKAESMEASSFWVRAVESDFPETRGWPAIDFTISSNGTHAYWLELHDRRFHHATVAKGGLGITTNAYYGIFVETVVPGAFLDMLAEKGLTRVERKTIGGVVCEGIRFVRTFRGGGEQRVTWYFSREDHLPRAQYHEIRTPVLENDYFMEIYNLQTESSFSPEEFALDAPPGFTVVDDDQTEIAVGTPAPSWRLLTHEGMPVTLDEQRGRVTVLIFWTSTCPVCRAYLDKVDNLVSELDAKQVGAFAINIGEPSETLYQRYLKRAQFKLPILEDGGKVAAAYKNMMTPGVFAVGKDGRLIYVGNGVANALRIEPLRRAIEAEIAKR